MAESKFTPRHVWQSQRKTEKQDPEITLTGD